MKRKKKKICIYLDADISSKFDAYCEKVGLSRGAVFEIIISQKLKINNLKLDFYGVKI